MRIGIDLGGTKTEAMALNDEGVALQRIRVPTPKGDYEGTIRAIVGLVEQLEQAHGVQGTVGVGIPGTVVPSTGLVKNANSTWLIGKPLEADLSLALDRSVRCANDANCFTVSEARDGAARGYETVFGVIIGTGCGGGIAVDGRIAGGPNGVRGEWGHTPLPWARPEELPGPPCYCGRTGCNEVWISGTGFEQDFERVTGKRWRGAEIMNAAADGADDALAALDRLQDRMARALAQVVNILDPDAIVLGGGLSNLDILYADGGLMDRIGDYTFGGGMNTPVLKNMHGDSSGVRGAAWLWPEPTKK
ncbi:MAG: ROK family protein [Acidobacteriaceae bacterium]|nr:ROK family protein [Acidobacteriaceae bacterium]